MKSQLAVLLSGGLDSTTLFRSAQTIFEIPETYSTGFPFTQDDGNVEQQYAESAAAALGVRHQYYQSTGEDYLRGLLPAIAAAEAPVHHLQSVLLWLLFKRGLGQDKTIVVSGEGADGIFGVDLQRRFWRRENKPALLSLFSAPPLAAAARWLTEATGRGRGVFEPALEALPGDDYENPDHELWSMSCHGKRERVLEQFECDKGDLFRSRLALVNHIKNRSAYDVISLLGLMGEATITQTIWSQMGERCGRFVDYPFLDPELLQFAFQTSWKDKLREPKWLIRAALRHLKVPEFIIRRPKSSFGLNRRGWALKNGMLEPLVPLAAKVFPERQIRSLQTQDESEASVFWALLNYALWRRLCIDGEPLETLQEELEQQIQDAKPAMDNALIRN